MSIFKKKNKIKVPSKRKAMFVNIFTAFSFYWFFASLIYMRENHKFATYIDVITWLNSIPEKASLAIIFILIMASFFTLNYAIYYFMTETYQEKIDLLQVSSIVAITLLLLGPGVQLICKMCSLGYALLDKICQKFTFVPWIMGTILIIMIIIGLIATKEDK